MRSAWWLVLLATACASCSDPTADTITPATGATAPAPSASTEQPEAPVPSMTAAPTTSAARSATGTATTEPAEPVVVPEGFDTTQALVTTADGDECDVCLWLADTSEQRSQGLMFVTDLGSADGMAFRYPRPHTSTFWMKNTVLPLSIAFFAPDGGFLESFDMEPCTTDACPTYPTPRAFSVAVEVPQGELASFGMVEGSRLALLDVPCEG